MVAGGAAEVAGEVYEVDPATLATLDDLEGYPELFERRRIRLAEGADAEAYLFRDASATGSPLIEGGDWLLR